MFLSRGFADGGHGLDAETLRDLQLGLGAVQDF
jgi:hypothetical protein